MYTENDFSVHQDRRTEELIKQLLEDNGCGCDAKEEGRAVSRARRGGCAESEERSFGLHGYPVAMVYSPIQEWRSLYDNEMGLERGTIFKELDLPFEGKWNDGGSCQRGICGGMRNG